MTALRQARTRRPRRRSRAITVLKWAVAVSLLIAIAGGAFLVGRTNGIGS